MFEIAPIGIIRSPFKEKFGVPRQAGVVKEMQGRIEFYSPFDDAQAFDGLEGYSHIWVVFVFDRNIKGGWQPKVRPPRLGGNRRVGVYASRSPFRPNPIGLSVVKLIQVKIADGRASLVISGMDMVDETPVIDIKPYVAYSDSHPEARSGFAPLAPESVLSVLFTEQAEKQLLLRGDSGLLRQQIMHLLEIDPRPAYVRDNPSEQGREYGFRLYDFDLRWVIDGETVKVLELREIRD